MIALSYLGNLMVFADFLQLFLKVDKVLNHYSDDLNDAVNSVIIFVKLYDYSSKNEFFLLSHSAPVHPFCSTVHKVP